MWSAPGLGLLVKIAVISWGIIGVVAFKAGAHGYFSWSLFWPVLWPTDEETKELEDEALARHHLINETNKKGTFSEQEQYKRFLEWDDRTSSKNPDLETPF